MSNIKKVQEQIDRYPGGSCKIAKKEMRELYQTVADKILKDQMSPTSFVNKKSFADTKFILDLFTMDSLYPIRMLVETAYPNLQELKSLNISLDKLFIPALNKEPGLQEHNEIFKEQLSNIFKYAKGKTSKKGFDFNDLDNSFYFEKDTLVLKNQNYAYEIQEQDGVYNIKAVNSPHEEDELRINNFSFDSKKDHFSVTKLDEPFTLAHFLLELDCATQAYEEKHKIGGPTEDQLEVVKSYEYYLAYHSQKHEMTKEDCVWHILFYGFPGGGQPDGNFKYDSREYLPYQKSIAAKMNNIHQTIDREQFRCPLVYDNNVKLCKKIKTLNPSWLRMFEDARGMVADFIERYENADPKLKDKMLISPDSRASNYADLKEFITIADDLIKKNKKTLNPPKI